MMKKRVPHPSHPQWYIKELEASEGLIPEDELNELWSTPFDDSPITPARNELRALFNEAFPKQPQKRKESIIHAIVELSGKIMHRVAEDFILIEQSVSGEIKRATPRSATSRSTDTTQEEKESPRQGCLPIHDCLIIARMIEGKKEMPILEIDLIRDDEKTPVRPFSYFVSYQDKVVYDKREVSKGAKPSQRRFGTPVLGIYTITFEWEGFRESLSIEVRNGIQTEINA